MAAPVAAGAAAGAAKGAGGAGAATGGVGAGGAGAAKGAGAKGGGLGSKLGNRLGRWGADRAADQGKSGEQRQKVVARVLVVVGGLVVMIVVLLQAAALPLRAGAGSLTGPFARAAGIPAAFLPMYEAAAEHYDVNPFLLAAIHKQESNFGRSSLAGVRSQWNGCGAAGPMQMGVVGVVPYRATVPSCLNPDGAGPTWDAHKNAFRPIADVRLAVLAGGDSYPLDRAELAGCERVPANVGCVYDSFDAIAAAAHKLSADGAGGDLYSAATRDALHAYNDDSAYVDRVLGQAREWELMAPGASAAAGARGLVDQAAQVARRFGTYVCSDLRPGSTTTGGGISDHAFNDANRAARDICVSGVHANLGPPPPALDRATVAIGEMFGRRYRLGTTIVDTFNWEGIRVQIIWRTPLYGGHLGHIHIGACRRC